MQAQSFIWWLAFIYVLLGNVPMVVLMLLRGKRARYTLRLVMTIVVINVTGGLAGFYLWQHSTYDLRTVMVVCLWIIQACFIVRSLALLDHPRAWPSPIFYAISSAGLAVLASQLAFAFI